MDILDKQKYLFANFFLLANKLQVIGDFHLANDGITTKQWFLILIISQFKEKPPMITDVANLMGTSRQNVKQLALKLEEKDWSEVQVEQYSFIDNITRLFYLKLNMSGIPVVGLHSYKDANATMSVKVAGLIPVVDGKGKEMNQGETVTVFNDMCILAPATLIDEKIEWESIDSLTAKATFNNEGIKISAILYFNKEGQLINFVSYDRYYSPTGKTYESIPWSTPVSNYKNINGLNLATYGEAVWNFPEGDFSYAKFNIKEIEYNYKTFQ